MAAKISKELVELAEKVRSYRTDVRLIEELKAKNRAYEAHIAKLEEAVKKAKESSIERGDLAERVERAEAELRKARKKSERYRETHKFIVTAPGSGEGTVYGEISRDVANAEKEVLIASPWITYIIDELSELKKARKAKAKIRVITRLIREDIENGMTDPDKLRILREYGADIRYNNNLHAKMVVIDRSAAVVSSANLTKRGASVNYEAGFCIRDKGAVKKVAGFFNSVWKDSKPLTKSVLDNAVSE